MNEIEKALAKLDNKISLLVSSRISIDDVGAIPDLALIGQVRVVALTGLSRAFMFRAPFGTTCAPAQYLALSVFAVSCF